MCRVAPATLLLRIAGVMAVAFAATSGYPAFGTPIGVGVGFDDLQRRLGIFMR